jgi:hypothetical protein
MPVSDQMELRNLYGKVELDAIHCLQYDARVLIPVIFFSFSIHFISTQAELPVWRGGGEESRPVIGHWVLLEFPLFLFRDFFCCWWTLPRASDFRFSIDEGCRCKMVCGESDGRSPPTRSNGCRFAGCHAWQLANPRG